MKQILYVDDDSVYSELYVDALKLKGFGVTKCDGPRSALDAMTPEQSFAAIVCDLMMPTQGVYDAAAVSGNIFTGASLARDARAKHPSVPIIIFTQLGIKNYISELEKRLSDLTDVFVLRKRDFEPLDFAVTVDAMISSGMVPAQAEGIIRRFAESLILKPALFGVGIDFKRLVLGRS